MQDLHQSYHRGELVTQQSISLMNDQIFEDDPLSDFILHLHDYEGFIPLYGSKWFRILFMKFSRM